jgi:hypothetical protein
MSGPEEMLRMAEGEKCEQKVKARNGTGESVGNAKNVGAENQSSDGGDAVGCVHSYAVRFSRDQILNAEWRNREGRILQGEAEEDGLLVGRNRNHRGLRTNRGLGQFSV